MNIIIIIDSKKINQQLHQEHEVIHLLNEHSERKQVRQCSFSIIDRCSFFLSRRVHQMVSDPILISIIHQSKIQSFDIEMKEYF